MEKIKHFNLPAHTNDLYRKEAISSISLTKDVADKINELVDAYNALYGEDLAWKQEQEGIIRKGVIYMKDNMINSLHDLLKAYDADVIRNFIIEEYGSELKLLKFFVTPQMFGAKGDGSTDDSKAIQEALDSFDNQIGGVLYFPEGLYYLAEPVNVNRHNVTIIGSGSIGVGVNGGFKLNCSHFKAIGLIMVAVNYSTECRAFIIDKSETITDGDIISIYGYVKDLTFKDCQFFNFFYSVCAIGGSYNHDGTEAERGYPIRDLVIENCYSETYTDQNAGHFQCIQVENISYINNRTYGGKNASSYNAIKANGYIRVIGNYDHNNSYASCEIENASGKAVIANNTFKSKIWIDDSFDAVVNGNTTDGGISVTVGSNVGDSKNIIISNNVTKNIRCEQFGTYAGGIIKNVNIVGNTVNGDNTHGIWVHGNSTELAKIANNIITGNNASNDIAIQRNSQLTCYISGNIGAGKALLIAGSGGKVFALDNYNVTVSGNRDSLPASHFERSFNGLKITDTDGVEWRLNISTAGAVSITKY